MSGEAAFVVHAGARGALQRGGSRAAFARAALANARGRQSLAAHLQRVVFTTGEAHFPPRAFDRFGIDRVPLDPLADITRRGRESRRAVRASAFHRLIHRS